jgi:hypothetical protein
MKSVTTASCFTTYMLPHILFVDGFEERQRIVMICCLAWNISIFPDTQQREQHIGMVWDMGLNDNPNPPPDGMEQGWKNEMRMLVAQKRDLFPRLTGHIPKAELLQRKPYDVLSLRTSDDGDSETPLITNPRMDGLPHMVPFFRRMHEDTKKQIETLQRAAKMPGVLPKIVEPEMVTAYCAQRADLISYHRMLTLWRKSQPDPAFKDALDLWLNVLNEIEADSKTVLSIITPALDE